MTRRFEIADFVPYIDDGKLHVVKPTETTPRKFQKALHGKARYITETYFSECKVVTRTEGPYVIFQAVSDGVPLLLDDQMAKKVVAAHERRESEEKIA